MPVAETREVIRSGDAHSVVLGKLEEFWLVERPCRTTVRLARYGMKGGGSTGRRESSAETGYIGAAL